MLRTGYLAYVNRLQAGQHPQSIPTAWNPNNVSSGPGDADWHDLGVENPNAQTNTFFAYDILPPGAGGGQSAIFNALAPPLPYRAQALRRTAPAAYDPGDPARGWLEMRLDTGEVDHSPHY